MDPPTRRRAAAVDTARPGAAAGALAAAAAGPKEQRSVNTAAGQGQGQGPDGKVLTVQSLQEFARQKKLERERRREEEAARLRATKLAAVAQRSGDQGSGGNNPVWNPATSAVAGAVRPTRQGRAGASHGGSLAVSCSSRPTSSAGSSGSSSAGDPLASSTGGRLPCGNERQSISSGQAQAPPPASQAGAAAAAGTGTAASHADGEPAVGALDGGPSGMMNSGSGTRWSPRKLPRAQQPGSRTGHAAAAVAPAAVAPAGPPKAMRTGNPAVQQPSQISRPASLASRISAAGAPPASQAAPPAARLAALHAGASATEQVHVLAPPPPQAVGIIPDAELDSAELEARRIQQLIDRSGLLVQATATVAAERVLLGPAALPDSQAPSSEELPLSFGQQPPADQAARATLARQQVAATLAALEQLRQLKLALLSASEQPGAASSLSIAERQLLQAEAAADLQAQSLLAHWGMQAACDAAQPPGMVQQQRQEHGG